MGDAVSFVVENGRITILWMEDEFVEAMRSAYSEHRYAACLLWLDNNECRVTITPEGSVGVNTHTGEEYSVYVLSVMRHCGPGGR